MSDVQRPLPPKKDVALALLEREPSVFIHLDPRRPGVSVPKWFTGQPQLILQIGLNMRIPIPDLKVDDDGISCTLSFSGSGFWCRLPWHAIWALVSEDKRGMVWPEDIPADLAAQKPQRPPAAAPQKPAKKPRPRLAAVGSPDSERGAEAEADDAKARSRADDEGDDATPSELEGSARDQPRAPLKPVAPALASVKSAEETDDDDSSADGAAPEPRRPGGKPKRELPPYLRVIK